MLANLNDLVSHFAQLNVCERVELPATSTLAGPERGGVVFVRFFTFLVKLLAGLAAAAFVLMVWFGMSGSPYRDDDPDLAWLRSQLDALEPAAIKGQLDLAQLNGGDWTAACLFGGYTYPTREMGNIGARVSIIDRLRFMGLDAFTLRIGEVEEFEVVVGYVDGRGRAKFLFFSEADAQNGVYCIKRPQTLLLMTGFSTRLDKL